MSFAFFEYTHTTQESQPAPHDGEDVNDGEDNASGNNGEDEPAADSYTHFTAITDSVREEAALMAPNNPNLPPRKNAQAQGLAVLNILTARQSAGKRPAARKRPADDRTSWTKPRPSPGIVFHSRGPAWREVNVKPADRLPPMTAEGMTHFRVNQFCELCTEWDLCSTHAALVSNDNVDFISKHFNAIKAVGYCLVECGGDGDCFYHSMLFLAKLYDAELYQAWHDHDQFRKNTCDNLLVFHYFYLLCCDEFEYTQIVSRFPTIYLE